MSPIEKAREDERARLGQWINVVLDAAEKRFVLEVLNRHGYRLKDAAAELEMDVMALLARLDELGLECAWRSKGS